MGWGGEGGCGSPAPYIRICTYVPARQTCRHATMRAYISTATHPHACAHTDRDMLTQEHNHQYMKLQDTPLANAHDVQ